MSAPVTDLGRIIRLDFLESHTDAFSFVLDKELQLEERPVTYPIVHLTSTVPFPDTFQVFHYNLLTVETANYVSTDIVVNPSHPTSFSSTHLLEKTFSGTSAFTLKLGSQIPVFPFNLLNFIRFIEPTVRTDSKIIYSEVDTENTVLRTVALDSIDLFRECEEEKTSSFLVDSEKGFADLPREVFFVTVRYVESVFFSGIEKAQHENISFDVRTSREIVSDTATLDYQLCLGTFHHTGSMLDTSDCELCGKFELFSDIIIDEFMQFDIVADTFVPRNISTVLQSTSVCIDGIIDFSARRYLDFGSRNSSHYSIESINLYKFNGNMEEQGVDLQRCNSSPHSNAVSPCMG